MRWCVQRDAWRYRGVWHTEAALVATWFVSGFGNKESVILTRVVSLEWWKPKGAGSDLKS